MALFGFRVSSNSLHLTTYEIFIASCCAILEVFKTVLAYSHDVCLNNSINSGDVSDYLIVSGVAI